MFCVVLSFAVTIERDLADIGQVARVPDRYRDAFGCCWSGGEGEAGLCGGGVVDGCRLSFSGGIVLDAVLYLISRFERRALPADHDPELTRFDDAVHILVEKRQLVGC